MRSAPPCCCGGMGLGLWPYGSQRAACRLEGLALYGCADAYHGGVAHDRSAAGGVTMGFHRLRGSREPRNHHYGVGSAGGPHDPRGLLNQVVLALIGGNEPERSHAG